MWQCCGIVRDAERLGRGLDWVRQNRAAIEAEPARGLEELEVWAVVRNMVTVAEMVLVSALARTESRGAHYRDDHPETQAEWLASVILEKGNEEPKVWVESVRAGVVGPSPLPAGGTQI
jgi:succinate dehydrogenase/fumarate reductase flavoprotein subunit